MLSSLNVAQSGLSAARTTVENVSNNIANENTPGYKKRIVQLSEQSQLDNRFTGRGVRADDTYRITSQYMYDNLMKENSRTSYYSETSYMVGNIEKVFQETDESGFSHDLNRFYQSIENLRANPGSEVYRTTFKTQGTVLVDSLQNLYDNIEKQEVIARKSLEDNVEKVNDLLGQIGTINEKLGQHFDASNDLLDKRDLLEKELSTYVDVEVDRTNNEYELRVAGQVAIRHNTNIRLIEIDENNTPQIDRFATTDVNGNPVDSINKAGNLDNNDVVTYKFDNGSEVSVKLGEHVQDANGNNVDITGDGVVDANDIVDDSNFVRGLVYKINHNSEMNGKVTAYNGNPSTDPDGNLVDAKTADKFLVIRSDIDGEAGEFQGRISVTEHDDLADPTKVTNRDTLYKDDHQSAEAKNDVGLSIYDSRVQIKSGLLKAQTENLTTDAPGNKFVDYKNKLDSFAQTISDVFSKFVKTGEDEYEFGHAASDNYDGSAEIKNLGLFSGTSVKTLVFNEDAVNDLKQSDLDYMAKVQWKKDLSFDGKAQDSTNKDATSFKEFFQELKVNISSDKENNDFLLKTQQTVEQSLTTTYDNLTKVDNDEEMVNLIKFQAAYSANAKVITVVDEMLQTLLGIR